MKKYIINSLSCDYFSEILKEKVMVSYEGLPYCGENKHFNPVVAVSKVYSYMYFLWGSSVHTVQVYITFRIRFIFLSSLA